MDITGSSTGRFFAFPTSSQMSLHPCCSSFFMDLLTYHKGQAAHFFHTGFGEYSSILLCFSFFLYCAVLCLSRACLSGKITSCSWFSTMERKSRVWRAELASANFEVLVSLLFNLWNNYFGLDVKVLPCCQPEKFVGSGVIYQSRLASFYFLPLRLSCPAGILLPTES